MQFVPLRCLLSSVNLNIFSIQVYFHIVRFELGAFWRFLQYLCLPIHFSTLFSVPCRYCFSYFGWCSVGFWEWYEKQFFMPFYLLLLGCIFIWSGCWSSDWACESTWGIIPNASSRLFYLSDFESITFINILYFICLIIGKNKDELIWLRITKVSCQTTGQWPRVLPPTKRPGLESLQWLDGF